MPMELRRRHLLLRVRGCHVSEDRSPLPISRRSHLRLLRALPSNTTTNDPRREGSLSLSDHWWFLVTSPPDGFLSSTARGTPAPGRLGGRGGGGHADDPRHRPSVAARGIGTPRFRPWRPSHPCPRPSEGTKGAAAEARPRGRAPGAAPTAPDAPILQPPVIPRRSGLDIASRPVGSCREYKPPKMLIF